MSAALAAHMPLLIIPAGGIKAVGLPRLAPQLFAPYESAWAWGAKLGAANALSAFEVSALFGTPKNMHASLLPKSVPRAAQRLGRRSGVPDTQLQHAFMNGPLSALRPLLCEHLRLCPICAREGRHLILHQMRPFNRCPLHDQRLREYCNRCSRKLAYGCGSSMVLGPINCPGCRAPQLAVSRSGFPKTSPTSAETSALIKRWLGFLLRRVTQSILFQSVGVIDAEKVQREQPERIKVCIPPRQASSLRTRAHNGRWSCGARHRSLELSFWTHANQRWRQCDPRSQHWYRRLLKGSPIEVAPAPIALAFVYWRMTWQGCSNPYLLRRGHALPLYGIAEWEAGQCARDEDDFEVEWTEFGNDLEVSWNDWLECIDLFGAKQLERHLWDLRMRPGRSLEAGSSKITRHHSFRTITSRSA